MGAMLKGDEASVTVTIDGPDEDRALEDLQAQFRANA